MEIPPMERRLASPVIVLLFILLFFCLGCVLFCCVGMYAFYAIGAQIDAGTMDAPLLGLLVGGESASWVRAGYG